MGTSDPKIIKSFWKEYSEGTFNPEFEKFTGVLIWDDYEETKWYMVNGEIHRDDGPAIENNEGYQAYYFYGQLHRRNGPAIIDPCGPKEWFLEGCPVSPMDVFEQLTDEEKEEIIWNLDQWR